jgi:PncC family amidohydrolase
METLVARLALALAAQGRTLSTAESCTGGLVGARLTALPGSSKWYLGGVITYSNELKKELLGIPTELLESHGAVSQETAQAMVEGVRKNTGSDLALSITGIAGPDGGTSEKPVGLVYIGVAAPSPFETTVYKHQLEGSRAEIRKEAARAALQHVLDAATTQPE